MADIRDGPFVLTMLRSENDLFAIKLPDMLSRILFISPAGSLAIRINHVCVINRSYQRIIRIYKLSAVTQPKGRLF